MNKQFHVHSANQWVACRRRPEPMSSSLIDRLERHHYRRTRSRTGRRAGPRRPAPPGPVPGPLPELRPLRAHAHTAAEHFIIVAHHLWNYCRSPPLSSTIDIISMFDAIKHVTCLFYYPQYTSRRTIASWAFALERLLDIIIFKCRWFLNIQIRVYLWRHQFISSGVSYTGAL